MDFLKPIKLIRMICLRRVSNGVCRMMLLLCLMSIGVTLNASVEPLPKRFDRVMELMYAFDFPAAEKELARLDVHEAGRLFLMQYSHFLQYLACDHVANYNRLLKTHHTIVAQLASSADVRAGSWMSMAWLQRAMVELNQGNQWQGGMAMVKAFRLFQEGEKKFSHLDEQLMLRGIFNVWWSMMPARWSFWSGLAGFKGNRELGLRQCRAYCLRVSGMPGLQAEARVLDAYLSMWTHLEPDADTPEGATRVCNSPLEAFLISGALSRRQKGEDALAVLGCVTSEQMDAFPWLKYQKGKLLLQKGDVEAAILWLNEFVQSYTGVSFGADARLRLAWAYRLGDREALCSQTIRGIPQTSLRTAVDRQARAEASAACGYALPLLQARLRDDFGMRDSALRFALSMDDVLPWQLEKQYRLGKIFVGMNRTREAIVNLKKVCEMAGCETDYRKVLSAIRLTEIYLDSENWQEAEMYLKMARKWNSQSGVYSFDDRILKLETRMRESRPD